MGTRELATALGCTPGLVSQLAKRGMPLTSPQAAQAWREVHAPPRTWKSKAAPSPITRPKPAPSPSAPAAPATATAPPSATPSASTEGDDPAESLRRAKATERQSFKKLEALQREKSASPEDLRKSSSVYFAARNNRARAEADHRDFLRAEGVTLFLSEAQDITNRGHLAVANKLREGPKALSPRLYGMSQKSIEQTLADFFDGIAEHLRQSF